jgi:Type II CAAX prenyl endopeptidase Rce1-like
VEHRASKGQLSTEDKTSRFLSHYWHELRLLRNPATPIFVAGVYCLVVLLCYYHRKSGYEECVAILIPNSAVIKEKFTLAYALEGLWYLLAPSVAILALGIIAAFSPNARDFFPQCRFRDFGLRIGTWVGWRDSLFFFLIVLPIVLSAGLLKDFSSYYPLSRLARVSAQWFVVWQAVQFLYFLGWEFLNRGFLVLGLEPYMGRWSILAAAVPFCLLHFGKPELEAVASFFAAIILGWLTLRARSILPATILHWGWALSLDAAVLFSKGGFPVA